MNQPTQSAYVPFFISSNTICVVDLPSIIYKPFLISCNLQLPLQILHFLRNLLGSNSATKATRMRWVEKFRGAIQSTNPKGPANTFTLACTWVGSPILGGPEPAHIMVHQSRISPKTPRCCSPIPQAACIQHWWSPFPFKRIQTPQEVVIHRSWVVKGLIRKIGCHTTVALPIKPTHGSLFRYTPTWHLTSFMKGDFWIKILWITWQQHWCNSSSDKIHTLLLITPVKSGGRWLTKKLKHLIGWSHMKTGVLGVWASKIKSVIAFIPLNYFWGVGVWVSLICSQLAELS